MNLQAHGRKDGHRGDAAAVRVGGVSHPTLLKLLGKQCELKRKKKRKRKEERREGS